MDIKIVNFDMPVIRSTMIYENAIVLSSPLIRSLDEIDYTSESITNYIIDKINSFQNVSRLVMWNSVKFDYKKIFKHIPNNITELIIADNDSLVDIMPNCWFGKFKYVILNSHRKLIDVEMGIKSIIEMINSNPYLEMFSICCYFTNLDDKEYIKKACKNQNIIYLENSF
jgi:hypothetical protein